jgi:hypothetical protein
MKAMKTINVTLAIMVGLVSYLPIAADNTGKEATLSAATIMAPPPPPCNLPVGVTKDMKIDFGAAGDGITDDSPAFQRASDWINANWSTTSAIKITVPVGTYLVGHQIRKGDIWNYGTGTINNQSQSYRGVNVFGLVQASNVIIEGDPNMGSRIIYKNGLMFGGYRTDIDQNCTARGSCNNCPNWDDVATVGAFVSLDRCSCVSVSNFWVEGRYNMCRRLGMVGECGSIQLGYDGVLIMGGSDNTISDVVCANFGRDGIMTLFNSGDATNVTLNNMISSGNGRQGFSLCSGVNLTANNCDFILTGNIKDGAIYSGNPQAGLDIEPDQNGQILNATFTNCRFSRNQGAAMITDNYFPSGVTFDNCFFSSLDGVALWPNGMVNSVIKNSTIVGRVQMVSGSSPNDHLVLDNNYFTDWFGFWDTPVEYTWATNSHGPRYLLDLGNPSSNYFFTFKNNYIELRHSLLMWMDIGVPTTSRIWDNNTIKPFRNDLASSTNGYPSCFVSNGFLGHFKCSTLNSNFITDGTPATSPTIGGYWIGVKCNFGAPSAGDNVTNGMNYFGPYGPSSFTHIKYNNNWCNNWAFNTGFW